MGCAYEKFPARRDGFDLVELAEVSERVRHWRFDFQHFHAWASIHAYFVSFRGLRGFLKFETLLVPAITAITEHSR